MFLRVAKAAALGVGTFAVTMPTLYAVLYSTKVGYLLFWSSVSIEPSRATEVSMFFVLNLALAAVAVLEPAWIASRGARRWRISPDPALLIAAILIGFGGIWFLRHLTTVNGCMSNINFPLGGGPYCDRRYQGR